MNADDVKWDAQGLAPAIVQDASTGEVLMLAWMNRESLARTLQTRKATFFSRSRNALWVKGETSGNTQTVRAVALDLLGEERAREIWAAAHERHPGLPAVPLELPARLAA